MKGDFTRGIEPDRRRGKRYRRVLVQQSRVLLDSDVAALVDSFDHELRRVTADLGCAAGSPDLGYLITPGRLLALFEHVDGVTVAGAGTAVRDYARKYPDEPEGRYPSLRVLNAAATVPLVEPLVGPVPGQLAFWYRADSAINVTVTAGTATTGVALAVATTWTRVTVPITVAAGVTLRDVTFTTGAAPVWIGLVELTEDRAAGAHFWAAAGRFHAAGLTPALAAATGYPAVSYPAAAGFPASDAALEALADPTRIVAYLETWERDITAAEDPGIREVALGKIDTTVRTEVKGQVKWALAGTRTAAELRRAFRQVDPPRSRLVVSAPTSPPSSDPCALPTSGGYSGADHRLYRFEVHAGGAPLVTQLKWSRDNACHVFPVLAVTGAVVTLERDSGLADGDLVEIVSEVVDLSDAARATVGATSVTPAVRQVGLLVRLRQEDPDTQGRDRFTLIDRLAPPATVDPSTDPARYPMTGLPAELVPLRLRRWDGVAEPFTAVTGQVMAIVEDGIELVLDGTFQPGEYWQFEARRGAGDTNQPWRDAPHGPERILAPLAALRLTAPAQPAVLEAWLDRRFSSLCRLDADDVAFDGDRLDTDADTVQEALEELYERDSGNCCDASLGPNGRTGDDTLRLRAAITATTFPEGGHLCLEPGVYDFRTPLVIDRDVVIRGCPEATLLVHGAGPLFRVTGTGRLRIEQLVLYNGPAPAARVLVELVDGARLVAREVGFLAAEAGGVTAAIADPGRTLVVPDLDAGNDPPGLDPDNLPPDERAAARVALRDCVVIATSGVIGARLGELDVRSTAFVVGDQGVAIAASQIDRLTVEDCAFRGGLPSTFFAAETPELLRGRSDDLLERAAALPVGAGTAIAVEFLLSGHLRGNHVSCATGLWARVARELAIRDDVFDRFTPSTVAVRLHHARGVDIEGMHIAARIGIQVPLSARRLAIRRCNLRVQLAGLMIAGEPTDELVNAAAFVGVGIEGNTVDTPDQGIVIGGGGTRAAEVDDVRLTGNVVRTADGGVNAIGITVIGDGLIDRAIVVESNDVTTNRIAIRIGGSGAVVRGNQLRLTANNGPAVTAFGSAAIGQVSVVDNLVTGVNNSFTAFQLLDTPDVVVTGNQVRSTAPFSAFDPPTALYVRGTGLAGRQYIVGNDFAAGAVTVEEASNLHLVGNAIRWLSGGSGTSGANGVVHGNQFSAWVLFIFPFSVILSNLRGMWKVSDNLAPGMVALSGPSHEVFIPDFDIGLGDIFVQPAAAATAGRLLERAQPEAMAAMMRAAGATSDRAAPAAAGAGSALGRRPVIAADVGSVRAVDSVIDDIVADAAWEMFEPVFDPVFEAPSPFRFITVIDPFDLHVSGNRFGFLTVNQGTSTTIPPHVDSTACVVDNKLTANLHVDMGTGGAATLDNVVANNSASSIDAPVFTTTFPIRSPNLLR